MRMYGPTTPSRGDSVVAAAGSTFLREEADMFALELLLLTIEDRHHHRQAHQHMDITEADERQMTEWWCLYSKDVQTERVFWRQKKADGRTEKRRKAWIEAQLAGPMTLNDKAEVWLGLLLTSKEKRTDRI
jgi:hypothetical protein